MKNGNVSRQARRIVHWTSLLLILMVAGSFFAFADPALRYQRASGRVERRGERSENRIERRDERAGGRIENRQERAGNRIERRDERISNRIERRDMLFSLPAEAAAVTVGGTRCYKVGGLIYRPAFYQGETVYVLAPE